MTSHQKTAALSTSPSRTASRAKSSASSRSLRSVRRTLIAALSLLVGLAVTGTSGTATAAPAPPAPATTVAFSGSAANPTVTVTGSSLGTIADLGTPVSPCCSSGVDYPNFSFSDTSAKGITTGAVTSGVPSWVGVIISSYTSTQVVFTLGSAYGTSVPTSFAQGDSFSLTLGAKTVTGTVNGPRPTISSVAFAGSPSNPTVTVTGSGFATVASLGSSIAPCCSSGLDYPGFALTDVGVNGFVAGQAGAGQNSWVGIVISSYSSTQIVFTLGSAYAFSVPAGLAKGDAFTLSLGWTTYSGTVSGPSPTISSVVVAGSPAAPVVVVTGSGFATVASLGTPVTPCCSTGLDYPGLAFIDRGSSGFTAGLAAAGVNSWIGVTITSYSTTQIVFTLGSAYGLSTPSNVAQGDAITFNLGWSSFSSTVNYGAAPTFAGITFANTIQSGAGKVPNCTTNNPFSTGLNDVNTFPNAICSTDGNAPAPSNFTWAVELGNGTPAAATPVINTGAPITVTVTKVVTHGTNGAGLAPALLSASSTTIPTGAAISTGSFVVGNIGGGDWIQVTCSVTVGSATSTLTMQIH